MSLYKDASLVMIPSAYKDGKLYSVRPVPVYGAEEVTNGDFATDSGWNKNSNWTISGGTSNCDGTSSNDLNQNQNLGVIGKSYEITFTITAISQGSVAVAIGSGITAYYTSVGTHSEIVTATTTDRIRVRVSGSAIASIDNVSIKEVSNIGDFTFSRGSNLSATRVNASQLIEKGRENLLLQSNSFDQWSDTTIVLTSGQTGYDGSSDAWLMAKNGSNSRIFLGVTTSGLTTTSVYAKANASNYLRLRLDTTNATSNTFFDLVNGLVDSSNYSIDAKIESVGNGWYRCSMVPNDPTTIVRLYPAEQTSTTDPTGSIYIQDAQVELGLVATPYIETGASTAQAGILENTPRLDYSGGATCPSLLLEPSRDNKIVQSEYFGGWTANTTITANAALSPEGVQNAYNIASNSGVGNGILLISGVLSSTQYVCSIYVKSAGATTGKLRLFDGSTGASTTTTFTPTSEWQRVEVTRTSGASTFQFRTDIHSNDGDLLIYGAQLEAGSYPTSYIPTYGVSQTRATDICNSSENSVLFNKTEGVLFLESSALAESNDRRISISDGTLNNYVSIGYSRFTGNIVAEMFANGVSQQPNWGATGVTQTDNNKFALSWGSGTMKFYVNGVQTLNESVISPVGLDILRFSAGNSSLSFDGETKQVIVFPTALSDVECIALTTI